MRLISSLNFLIPAFNNSHLKQSESLAWSQLCWDMLLILAAIAIISVVWSQWFSPVLQIIDPIGPQFLSEFSKSFFSFICRYSTASRAFSRLLAFILSDSRAEQNWKLLLSLSVPATLKAVIPESNHSARAFLICFFRCRVLRTYMEDVVDVLSSPSDRDLYLIYLYLHLYLYL